MNKKHLFLNDLYVIKNIHSENVNRFSATIEINPGHPVFKGHFPGNPILPGVCTLQIIRELVSEHLGEGIRLQKAGTIKYTSFINPLANRLIELEIDLRDEENGSLGCNATVHSGETSFCSFKGGLLRIK